MKKTEIYMNIIEDIEYQIDPKEKLICMLHTDGWSNVGIIDYFAGSVWETTEPEVNEILSKVRDLIHKYIIN